MADSVGFHCSCGKVSGCLSFTSARQGTRIICHCRDCQAFVRHFDRDAEILGDHGGTDIVQTAPDRLTVASGRENLAALKLTEKGVTRWYAACCGTPLANTPGTAPFVGLLVHNLDAAKRETALGPPLGHVFVKSAIGDTRDLKAVSPLSIIRPLLRMVAAWMRGANKHSPFVDAASGTLICKPHPLTEDERARAYATSH